MQKQNATMMEKLLPKIDKTELNPYNDMGQRSSVFSNSVLSKEALAKLNSQKPVRNNYFTRIPSEDNVPPINDRYASNDYRTPCDKKSKTQLFGSANVKDSRRTRNEAASFVQKSKGSQSQASASKSMTHARFLQHRETIQQTLIRKFKQKYIDANPEFTFDFVASINLGDSFCSPAKF